MPRHTFRSPELLGITVWKGWRKDVVHARAEGAMMAAHGTAGQPRGEQLAWAGGLGSGHEQHCCLVVLPTGWTPGSATRTPGRPPAVCWSTTVT